MSVCVAEWANVFVYCFAAGISAFVLRIAGLKTWELFNEISAKLLVKKIVDRDVAERLRGVELLPKHRGFAEDFSAKKFGGHFSRIPLFAEAVEVLSRADIESAVYDRRSRAGLLVKGQGMKWFPFGAGAHDGKGAVKV